MLQNVFRERSPNMLGPHFRCVIYTLGIWHTEKDFSVVVEHHFECQKILRGLGNKSYSV